MQLSVVTLVACFLLTTGKTTASQVQIEKLPHSSCKHEEKEGRSDSSTDLCKQHRTSSKPDSTHIIEKTSLTPPNDPRHSSRKNVVVKNPEQLKVLSGVQVIKDKRIRQLMDSFQRGDLDVDSTHKVKMKQPHVEHMKDQGVQSVIHLLRLQALKAVDNLKKKMHNGTLSDVLSHKGSVNVSNNKTLSTQEKLESSRNKLFKDVRKLIHRIIQRKKKTLALEVNEKKLRQAKDKAIVVEHSDGQRTRRKPVRKVHNEMAKKFSSHHVYDYNKSDRQKDLNDESGTLAIQPISASVSADDDGKWASRMELNQFFNQMKGLPMDTKNGESLYGAQSWNAPSGSESPAGMMSPSESAADLTSPLPGVEGFNANNPRQMLQQEQNQMQSMADYFNTQSQSRGTVQQALMSQPAMGNTGLDTQAAYPPDLSSIMQMNNPLASFQPFLSRFYRPSMPFNARNPQNPERVDDLDPASYQDQGQDEEQGPDWDRDQDDDEEEGPVPPDVYPEDRDEEASDHDDDGDDEEDDDADPYHRRQKSTIQFPMNKNKPQPSNHHQNT